MKNAVRYREQWLAKNSRAYELWDLWSKSKDPKDQKVLDKHLDQVAQTSNKLMGIVTK